MTERSSTIDEQSLEVRDLAVRRGDTILIEHVSFSLTPGDALLIRGPNGSGKTSLLRVLAGIAEPATGEIRYRNEDPRRAGHIYRTHIHAIFAANALKARLTAGEQIRFGEHIAGGASGGDKALLGGSDALDIQIIAEQPIRTLSTGQKRRLALSRLVSPERPIWILDEPEAGLDQSNRMSLQKLIEWHRTGGGIAIVATHGNLEIEDPLIMDLGANG